LKIWKKNYHNYRSFDGREEERKKKELNKQTKEILISEENSLTNKQTKEILISKENSLTNKQTKNLRDFHQTLVKFYQLFATDIRWSLENLKKKLPNLSFVWREGESSEERLKKAEFCKKEACGQPNKQTNLKTEKTTPRFKTTLKKKLKSRVSLKTDQNWVK